MEYVDGLVLRTQGDCVLLTDGSAHRVGSAMVDSLLDLHAVEPEAVGLDALGRWDGYLSRQVRVWGRQLDDDNPRSRAVRLLIEVREQLGLNPPPQQVTSIVHGDYRLDNVVVSPQGSVVAVLDWELCTLGDPLADVATLAIYWSDPGDSYVPLETATWGPGFQRREEVIKSYIDRSGLDFSRFPYYLAFASWRLAVILFGVVSRYDAGAYVQVADSGWERLREVIPLLAESASDHLRRDSSPY
jgi:aminoglycoside phosphotransferase (APT) family kinase protein